MFAARKHRLVRTELGLEWPSCLDCRHARHWPSGPARCKKNNTLTEITREGVGDKYCGKTGRHFQLRRLPWPRLAGMYWAFVVMQATLVATNLVIGILTNSPGNILIGIGIAIMSIPMIPVWAKLWRRIRGKA
jgi:hypothetical protein